MRDEAIERAKEDMREEMNETVETKTNETKEEMEERIQQAKRDNYPIGSIYISTDGTNPEKLFGGKWEEYGKGRTLVGVDITQLGFNTPNSTGGEKTVTLNSDNLPSHNHTIPALSGTTNDSGSHSHNYSKANTPTGGTAITIAQMPAHEHNYKTPLLSYITTGNGRFSPVGGNAWETTDQLWASGGQATASIGGGQAHTHTIGFTTTATTAAGIHSHTVSTTASSTGYSGGGKEFSVQNPYITVYMWRRVE